jgi:hypothetical protein
MEDSVILPVWQVGGIGMLADALADDVTFSSPAADYRGRENVAHMLELIATVLDDIAPVRGWGDTGERVSAFTARVQGEQVQGMLREERGPAGELVRVTLFLRPYRVLRMAIAQMGERLAVAPLPRRTA